MTLRSRRVGVNGTSIHEVFYAPYPQPRNVAYGASFIQTAGATGRSVASLTCALRTRFFTTLYPSSGTEEGVLYGQGSLPVWRWQLWVVLAAVLVVEEREFSESNGLQANCLSMRFMPVSLSPCLPRSAWEGWVLEPFPWLVR